MRKLLLAAASVLLLASCSTSGPAYKNPALSAEKRADDLLSRMSVEEKIGQLLCPLGWPMYSKDSLTSEVTYTDGYVKFIQEQKGGMLYGVFRADPWTRKTLEDGLWPAEAAKTYNMLQHYAIDSTRLGIPIILAEEIPHGHMAIGTTVFPTGIGMSATWDPELLGQVGRSIAEEVRSVGACIGYGPVIDLSREPRWSRVEETYGEDVCLTSQMASGFVGGMSPEKAGWDNALVATLKHFVAYGIPQGGHNGNPSAIGERDLAENIFPTFKSAIDSGAYSVMTSYNSIDGVPSTGNEKLLRDMLKGEWGFDGIVVSDLVSIDGLSNDHHVAKDTQEAGEMAINAGVDVDLGANCYALLKEGVESGRVSKDVLDDAVRRVLLAKFRLGLFDNPYVDETKAAAVVRNEEHTQTALQVAREGVILLKNDGILPLSKDARVAVIGPNADRMYNQLGDYTAPQPDENITTPLEGIRNMLGEAKVTYVRGCAVRDESSAEIAKAAQAARNADVAVVFVGGSSARDFETKYKETGAAIADETLISDMEAGEGFDRASLTLLGRQEELLKAVKAAGKPVVVVYIEGRPLDKNWASENADALLTQFYPGQAGGEAIAEVLFGDYNPAGRLPISVPRSVGQLPVYYNKPFPAGHDYVEMSAAPLYSFGYGLSYTTFDYSNLACTVTGPSEVTVSVDVTNSGKVDGDEVVQIYVTDPVASTVRPQKQLRAFRRVGIKAGEKKTVTFKLGRNAFELYDRNMNPLVEPGEYIVKAGAASDDIRLEQSVEL